MKPQLKIVKKQSSQPKVEQKVKLRKKQKELNNIRFLHTHAKVDHWPETFERLVIKDEAISGKIYQLHRTARGGLQLISIPSTK
ncbi:MAG: hypothetical protein JRJ77_12115 [Deltaproteobacteria bacterium]|nr:hypothetical protein [Deltaproteobacteria bacterium]